MKLLGTIITIALMLVIIYAGFIFLKNNRTQLLARLQKKSQPTPITTSAPKTSPADNILVTQPPQVTATQVIVNGKARVFESQFNYRLKDASGRLVSSGTVQANAPDAATPGPFEIKITLPTRLTGTGTLELFDLSPRDGAEINKISLPVTFKK